MKSLDGKVAIVTGASRGIGRAIALVFAREGAGVVATARSTNALASLADEMRALGSEALPVTADLAVEADVQRIPEEALGRFGRIDILVNNAGIIPPSADLIDHDIGLWREVIEVNLISVALLTRAVLPSMIEHGYGKVINISSIGGRKGNRGRSAYRVTKAALISLTECIAAEVKQYGIDVNGICPGGVDTEGFRSAFGSTATSKLPNMPPSAIADIALFLVSDASAAITGTSIDAFGGSNPIFARPVRLEAE